MIALFILSLFLGGCVQQENRTTTPITSPVIFPTSTTVIPPLQVQWQGKTFIATKGIYIGQDVELLGSIGNNQQVFKRKQQANLTSILLKIGNDQYQIYQLRE